MGAPLWTRQQSGSGAGALARRLPFRTRQQASEEGWAEPGSLTTAQAQGTSQTQVIWQNFREQRIAYWSLLVLLTFAGMCIFLPFVLPWGQFEYDSRLLGAYGPSLEHPLGTDKIGRDQLTRVLSAGRISLLIGLLVATISVGIGAVYGVVSGYFGGRADTFMMWLVNVLMTIPGLPLLIALSVLVASPSSHFGAIVRTVPEAGRIILVMSLLGWMGVSRIVRSQVLSLKNQEYVEAAHAMGTKHPRVMFLHILPNCIPAMVVFGTFGVSGAIMGESFLSFLGMGVQPPVATWGNMLNEASDINSILNNWWLTWAPATAILITVLCINFVGEGLRVAVDPKAGGK